jgi:HAE1 family hydrophobic/amphiphilic exporter-1
VIGGTITSTMLTLLVIPTVYETLVELRERLSRLFRGRRHPPAHPPAPPTPQADRSREEVAVASS